MTPNRQAGIELDAHPHGTLRPTLFNAAACLSCLVAGTVLAAGISGCRVVDKGHWTRPLAVCDTDETCSATDLGPPSIPALKVRLTTNSAHGLWRLGAAREGRDLLDCRRPGQSRCLLQEGSHPLRDSSVPIGMRPWARQRQLPRASPARKMGAPSVNVDVHAQDTDNESHDGFQLKAGSKRRRHHCWFRELGAGPNPVCPCGARSAGSGRRRIR